MATSLPFVTFTHLEGLRGGRLTSRQHAGRRQNRHDGIRYPINHFSWTLTRKVK
jgi:hypothetical protein